MFGRLTVVGRAENAKDGSARWHCECICGGKSVTMGANLRRGSATSCGCIAREKAIVHAAKMGAATRTHGACDTAEYRAWVSMQQRCYNDRHRQYKNYGARGITVCDQWRNDFKIFLADIGMRPSSAYSLDRRENSGNYEPGNCGWATSVEQNNNTRANVIVSLNGAKMTFAEAVRQSGKVKYGIARQRVYRDGWSLEDALCASA